MAVADSISALTLHPSFDTSGRPRNFPAADCVLARVLGAGAAESITVPGSGATKARYVRIVATVDSYLSFSTTASVPTDTTDGTASELLPAGKVEWFILGATTTISVISSGTPIVTASFYRD